MTTRCINDDDLVLVLAEVSHTGLGDLDGVSLLLVTIERALDLGSVHLELSEGTGSECISADNTNLPALLHVVVSELGTSCRLTGTLKTDEHDYIWLSAYELISFVLGGEHICQLVHHCLLDHFFEVRSRLTRFLLLN